MVDKVITNDVLPRAEPHPTFHREETRVKILFIGEGVTLAHVSRPLVLARALDRKRYEVSFACGETFRGFVEAAGISPYPIPTTPPEDFARRTFLGKPQFPLKLLAEYVKAELDLFSRTSPDFVVGDFRVSLGISTEVAGIPYIALADAYWSPFSTESLPVPEHPSLKFFGIRIADRVFPLLRPLFFQWHAWDFNRLRRQYGLRPVAGVREMLTCGTWTLYLAIPTVAPTHQLPPSHRYLGPILWEPDLPLPPWWEKARTSRPLVYVTLGSSGDPRLMEPLLDALEGLSLTAAVATAGRGTGPLPMNVFSADYLPGLKILEGASLVVSNGGSPTTYQALSRGVPVLGLPTNADQYFAMQAVARKGAGILIRSGLATAPAIRRAIERLLSEDSYRHAAKILQAEIACYPAERDFATFIESLHTKTCTGSRIY